MDALDILKSDHERILSIYGQIKAENGQRERMVLFENLRNEILTHTRIEESVFYPAFKNYPDFQQLLVSSYDDHRKFKERLKKMVVDGSPISDIASAVDHLMSDFQAHVQTEENEFFPLVRKLLKRSEREIMGRHLQAARSEAAAAA